MKAIARLALFLTLALAGTGMLAGAAVAATELSPDQGAGSCYEVQPICIQGKPQCMCTFALQCYWACR